MNIHTRFFLVLLSALTLAGCLPKGTEPGAGEPVISESTADEPITPHAEEDALPARDLEAERSTVGMGLAEASSAKVHVVEMLNTNGIWPSSNAEANYDAPVDRPVQVAVGDGGAITVTYANLEGNALLLTPTARESGQIDWICTNRGFDDAVIPKDCM